MASDPGRQRQTLTAWEYPIQYDPIFTATLGAHSSTEYLAPIKHEPACHARALPPQPDPADSDDAAQNYPSRRAVLRLRFVSIRYDHPSLHSSVTRKLLCKDSTLHACDPSPCTLCTSRQSILAAHFPPISLPRRTRPSSSTTTTAHVTHIVTGVGQSVGSNVFRFVPSEGHRGAV